MAQRNRKRPRNGGGATRKAQDSANGEHTPGRFESGEEQLTEAQAAFGRPEPGERPSEQELTAFEEADAGRGGGDIPGAVVRTGGGDDGDGHSHAVGERKPGPAGQLVGFLKGSWRELQRVQWPDRRQVFQATGVVLGFVIVAGAFLGVASFAAQKIVNLILYGHG